MVDASTGTGGLGAPQVGVPEFAAQAEGERRTGRAAEAERVARAGLEREPDCLEGRLVLALALLDQERVADARLELERLCSDALAARGLVMAPIPAARAETEDFAEELTDLELDRALSVAEAERDQLVDADDVAHLAMREAERDLADELAGTPNATFATHTVADLLESQGDQQAASQIRAALADEPASSPPSEAGSEPRGGALTVLEHWLDNLRKERA